MEIFNSFLYRIITDYIDLDSIISLCKSNGSIKIKDNEIFGSCFDKENKKNIKIIYGDSFLKGYVLSKGKKEIFKSYVENGIYISKYNVTNILANDKNNYSVKKINKKTIYNKDMEFLARKEIIKNIFKIKNGESYIDIDKLCYDEITTFIKIDDKNILKKDKIIYNNGKENTYYSISSDFKKGVFLSEDSKCEDYYLGFSKIEEKKYNKLLKKIFD